ncbi:MAG: CcmD family protein [Candidatus Methanoperedens sp.]|nr:CcmD family protein [Candidatus Methanoperedens sp.]
MVDMIYLYTAFGIVWVVLIGYLLNLLRLRMSLNNELNTVESLKL